MNIVHETEPNGPATIRTASSENLTIKEGPGPKSPMARWLRLAQIAAQIIFYIGCGAVAVALEQLMKIFRAMDGGGDTVSPGESGPRKPEAQPQSIKVPMLPIDNYNRLNSKQVIGQLAGLSEDQLRIVRAHEARQKNRMIVLEAIDRRLTGGG
jgi:hypothetical protein